VVIHAANRIWENDETPRPAPVHLVRLSLKRSSCSGIIRPMLSDRSESNKEAGRNSAIHFDSIH